MKKFSLNAVAAAALGFAASGAFATVDIDLTTPAPALFSSEIVASASSPVTLLNPGTLISLQSAVGYALSVGEVRYVRVELANGKFATAAATSPNGATGIGAINGVGTSVIYFSITAGAGGVPATEALTIAATVSIEGTASNVTVSYSVYDQPSQAQAGGTTGRIVSKADKQYINFATGQRVVAVADSAVSNVEVNPAFTTFSTGQTSGLITVARLASLDFRLAATVPNIAAGTPITLALLNATGTSGTKLAVTGDFSAAANSDGTYTVAALQRVYLATATNCAAVAVAASAVTATSATFNVGATATTANPHLCFAPRDAGVSTSTNQIPASTYTAALNAVSATPAVYAVVTPINSGTVSTITRNGTELQAPLVQVPGGYITRFVLTNTGTVDATYTGTVVAGPGSVIGSNGTLTGTIPAGGQAIIEGTAMPQWTSGPARGFARFTVARPSNQIQGVYQIVNATTGSVSNTVMVRPGTN